MLYKTMTVRATRLFRVRSHQSERETEKFHLRDINRQPI